MFFRPRLDVFFSSCVRRYRPRGSGTVKKRTPKVANDWGGIDIDMELEPVDVKKLTLPVHNLAKVPPDIIANLKAKDRTLVFSPSRQYVETVRRLERLRHEMNVQPLCRVIYIRPRRPDGTAIAPPQMARLSLLLTEITRFIIADERWPREIALEVTPYIEGSGGAVSTAAEVVSSVIEPLLRDEMRIAAHVGTGPTAVLAKMACDACALETPSAKKSTVGIIALKEYRLSTHEAVQHFVKDTPIASIPSVGAAQVDLMRDVYGITKCGEILTQSERLCFSLAHESLRYFMGVGFGVARLPAETTTTLLRKVANLKTKQLRRESQFGRIISDEKFMETVSGVFDLLHGQLLSYDFVCGRVSLETRRTVPSLRWIVEESATLPMRTNDRKLLRDTVMELAKKFAPRRTKVKLDPYTICLHFSDLRLWASENAKKKSEQPRSPPRKVWHKSSDGIIHM